MVRLSPEQRHLLVDAVKRWVKKVPQKTPTEASKQHQPHYSPRNFT